MMIHPPVRCGFVWRRRLIAGCRRWNHRAAARTRYPDELDFLGTLGMRSRARAARSEGTLHEILGRSSIGIAGLAAHRLILGLTSAPTPSHEGRVACTGSVSSVRVPGSVGTRCATTGGRGRRCHGAGRASACRYGEWISASNLEGRRGTWVSREAIDRSAEPRARASAASRVEVLDGPVPRGRGRRRSIRVRGVWGSPTKRRRAWRKRRRARTGCHAAVRGAARRPRQLHSERDRRGISPRRSAFHRLA